MVDSADEPPLSSRIYSWAKSKTPQFLTTPRAGRKHPDSLPKTHPHDAGNIAPPAAGSATSDLRPHNSETAQQDPSVVVEKGEGTHAASMRTTETKEPKASLVSRFLRDVKYIIFSSWINWLLIFVPVGIILGALVDWAHSDIVSPSVVFAINAVAIIPLASLLAYATESVASKMGDTVGALLNVTFGNAVELIVFIIALVADEVRVVQAAALGSILSNLLLILGMSFVAGGLRYREQLYNSTVSQMSACLLCLSVLSLVLPTAFHASFEDPNDGNRTVLTVSRGTSVVLLLVYGLYLVFSLKSHSFMYASTPQHLIDEESHPGVLAELLNSSSSSDSSSSSSSDSDSSLGSHTTAKKRIKRAFRRRRRKSVSSKDNASVPSFARTLSDGTNAGIPSPNENAQRPTSAFENVLSGDEADVDGEGRLGRRRSPRRDVYARDFESGSVEFENMSQKQSKHSRRHKHSKHSKMKQSSSSRRGEDLEKSLTLVAESKEDTRERFDERPSTPRVTIVDPEDTNIVGSPRRPFTMRNFSEAVHAGFNSTVFPHHEATGRPLAVPIQNLRAPSQPRQAGLPNIRRTSSMPDMIHPTISNTRPILLSGTAQAGAPNSAQPQEEVAIVEVVQEKHRLSTTSAVITLLFTTAFVALCAEFLVGSLDYLISSSGVSQAFIGLIILPMVGNAAEHVTAVTVAAKNKMDLAIGIALGSSIQIALFVTPFMVILGWIIGRDMSLYFSLFETVALFASTVIVCFLLIDGRSNYLEGALLMAAYIIIAVSAFYYPSCPSRVSGTEALNKSCPPPTQGTARLF